MKASVTPWEPFSWHYVSRMVFPRLRRQLILVLGSWLFFGGAANAQQPATVSFTFDFPGSVPPHYAVTVSEDGHTTYESAGTSAQQSETDDSFRSEFIMSAATRSRIFELARKAHYFQQNLETKKRNIASTGMKTLAYRDGERSGSGTYNYSPSPAVQELTQIFQSLSTTLEFGQRLQYCYRYQKLALDEEMNRMEEMNSEGGLEELGAVVPILQKIAADPSVMNVVRARAQRLIAQAGAPSRK